MGRAGGPPLQTGNLPASFALDHEGGTFRGELDGAATYTERDLERQRRWTFEDDDATTPRHRLFSRLYRLLQAMPPGPQHRAIGDIRHLGRRRPTRPRGARSLLGRPASSRPARGRGPR